MSTPRTFSTAAQVCIRYGGRSHMWLWRRLKSDPTFPRPMRCSGSHLRLFDNDELDAYDAAQARDAMKSPE